MGTAIRAVIAMYTLIVAMCSFATEETDVPNTNQPDMLVGEWIQDSPRMWHKFIRIDEMPPVKVTFVVVDIITIIKDDHLPQELHILHTRSKVVIDTPCREIEGKVDTLIWYMGNQEGDLVSCTGTVRKLLINPIQSIIGNMPETQT
jgi:hypothetical protein